MQGLEVACLGHSQGHWVQGQVQGQGDLHWLGQQRQQQPQGLLLWPLQQLLPCQQAIASTLGWGSRLVPLLQHPLLGPLPQHQVQGQEWQLSPPHRLLLLLHPLPLQQLGADLAAALWSVLQALLLVVWPRLPVWASSYQDPWVQPCNEQCSCLPLLPLLLQPQQGMWCLWESGSALELALLLSLLSQASTAALAPPAGAAARAVEQPMLPPPPQLQVGLTGLWS